MSGVTKNQVSTLCWLGVGMICAVGLEGGRPWALWRPWESGLRIAVVRASIVGCSTFFTGAAVGIIARLAKFTARRCRIVASQASLGLAIVGCCVDIAYQGNVPSIWFPLALFAPRLAQKIAFPQLGFWSDPDQDSELRHSLSF